MSLILRKILLRHVALLIRTYDEQAESLLNM